MIIECVRGSIEDVLSVVSVLASYGLGCEITEAGDYIRFLCPTATEGLNGNKADFLQRIKNIKSVVLVAEIRVGYRLVARLDPSQLKTIFER